MLSFDESQIRAFLPHVLIDGYCSEVRAFKAQFRNGNVVASDRLYSAVGGFFDDPGSLIATVTHFDGTSPYITCNPVKHDLIARIANKVKFLSKGEGTKDEDIAFIRWIPLDLDPVRPDGISSTDEELTEAIALQDKILRDNPDIERSSIWGKSGNGCWIWVRVPDLPNTPETYERVRRFMDWFAVNYGDKGKPNGQKVYVDRKTCNASRVCAFPGVLKCKGENDRKRPWRLATIDCPERGEIPTIDLEQWEKFHKQASEKNGRKIAVSVPATIQFHQSTSATGEDRLPRIRRAASYLSAKPPAISGQGGHDQTFTAATDLVHGFGLSIAEATPILEAWNLTCQPPWDSADLSRKLKQAESTPHAKPYGHLFDSAPTRSAENGSHTTGEGRELLVALLTSQGKDISDVDHSAAEPTCPPGMEANPHRLARLFLSTHYSHCDGPTLRFWRDEFFGWNGTAYSPIPNKEIRASVSKLISEEFQRIYITAMIRHGIRKAAQKQAGGADISRAEKEPKLLPVSNSLVTDTIQALSGIVLVPVSVYPSQPAWLDEISDWDPKEILPTTTALVHLPSLAAGQSCLREPTPRFFSRWACDYGFSESAPVPVEWHKFLATVWKSDPISIELLQEWFGYCLTLDTRQQKMLMLIGPKRSGKGTIANVLSALLGPSNVAGPTLSGLADNFGLAPLVGKPLAIVDDARLSGRSDQAVIAERLLTISGEGTITVERKYLDAWTGKLPTRIMLLSNELPKLLDSSGALPGRLLILRLTQSFYGDEDKSLLGRLLAELPGILLWAINGWTKLQSRGYFRESDSAHSLKNAMGEMSSPISEFVAEQCVVWEEAYVARSELFNAWKTWNQAIGVEHVRDERMFGRWLHSVVPNLGCERRQRDGVRVRFYTGIRLKTHLEHSVEAAELPACEPHQESAGKCVGGVPF